MRKAGTVRLSLFPEIATPQTQIERQQKQIDELKKIVCTLKPDAEVCQTKDK